VSIWKLDDGDAPGIVGRRISIETTSKVWNACGLRIGALITDSEDLHRQCVAENTASLCSNAIGQHVFGALAHLPVEELQAWFAAQRDYYGAMLRDFVTSLHELLPEIIVSRPDASIYSVVDLRELVDDDFEAADFARWCAASGAVDGETLLTAPMGGFYNVGREVANPGRTQLRISYVLAPDDMKRVPTLLAGLFRKYLEER